MIIHVPSNVRRIIQVFQIRHIQVTGPVSKGGHIVYHVNGHALTEGEIRELSMELADELGIFNYIRKRAE
jgi:hypothetical protein